MFRNAPSLGRGQITTTTGDGHVTPSFLNKFHLETSYWQIDFMLEIQRRMQIYVSKDENSVVTRGEACCIVSLHLIISAHRELFNFESFPEALKFTKLLFLY